MKTFELTQDQINQLAEVPNTQYLLRKFVPEAFNTEPVKGNWYISQYYLIYYLGNSRCHCIKLSDGKWLENIYHSLTGHLKNYRSATEEEIEVALIREAKKRFGRGWSNAKIEKCLYYGNDECVNANKFNISINFEENLLWNNNGCIFNSGEWAKPLTETKEAEPTSEEINRVLEYLKNQNK